MTLINQKPYNPGSYTVNDYALINAEHPVTTAYLDVLTEVSDVPNHPPQMRLWQNYPNPFNL